MPRTHPTQLLADVVAELRGVNERLDTLLARSAPQATPVPAGPPVKPAPVRLEEPVRPTSESGKVIDIPIAEPVDVGAMPKIDPEGTCQEQTKRGNTCGKPLPCRYHG